jgi:outer membrane protein assembly factor BamD (BamD/ComL family)
VSAGTLAAERQALDVAKAAFGRGEAAFALKACEDHARRFPNGVLAEEREAIAIQALVETSERTLARARAERFQQRYPKSILWPVVSGALEKAP